MKHYLAIILTTFILFSCTKGNPKPSVNLDLLERLQEAENIRFYRPEVVDTILTNIVDALRKEDTDELWAKYYFLKAHVEYERGDYEQLVHYIDSAKLRGLDNDSVYNKKIVLLEALTKESLKLYDEAWQLYNFCNNDICDNGLTDNEKLKAYLAQARIAKSINLDIEPYLFKADKLVKGRKEEIDLGLYYSNMAFFSTGKERLRFSILSNNYYRKNNLNYQLVKSLDLIANSFINHNIDSAIYYHNEASVVIEELNKGFIGLKKEDLLYHLYVGSKLLIKNEEYEKCITILDSSLYLSDIQKSDLFKYRFKILKSKVLFITKQYKAARVYEEKAYEHYLDYDKKIARNKIMYINAQNHINTIKQENEILCLKDKSTRQKNSLYLFYSIIISVVLIFLIYNSNKLKRMLDKSHQCLHKKEISLLESEDMLKCIYSHLNVKTLPAKTIVSKISQELNKTQNISSWDNFNERYRYQYPKGERNIRVAYPDLKAGDVRYLMCCHYGLTDSKMADVFGIKETSVRKQRQRIKERLKLNSEDDLQNFILKILSK